MTPVEANVAAVMTVDPIVVEADYPIVVAERAMSDYGIRHLPVVEKGRFVGLVSQRDLIGAADHDLLVRDVMVDQCAVTRPDARACEAARALLTLKVGCLPVLADGKLIGIVTDTDFVRVAYAMLSAVSSSVRERRPRLAKPRPKAKKRHHARK
jgi:CBS domain-containing protein